MISGTTFVPSFASWQAASMIARVCISVISGYVMPRRTPRWPSIGLNSWSCSTRRSSACFSSSSLPFLPLLLHPRDLDHQVFALRQELVQRRIDRADRDRLAVHRLEHAVEVAALQRQQLVERLAAIRLVVGEDHPLHDGDAAFAEEHVLGAAEADAARAERVCGLGLVRLIRVGADAEPPVLVGPRQQLLEALVDVRLLRLHLAGDDLQDLARLGRHLADLHFAGQAVERDAVPFLDRLCRRP